MGKEEVCNFRYCGKDVAQSVDGTVRVTCKDSTLRIGRIKIAAGRKPSEPVTEAEATQLESVAGALSLDRTSAPTKAELPRFPAAD